MFKFDDDCNCTLYLKENNSQLNNSNYTFSSCNAFFSQRLVNSKTFDFFSIQLFYIPPQIL